MVPIAGITRWRSVMVGGIIAGENIAGHWKYLGAAAASPHPGPGPWRGTWPLAAVGSVQALAWAPGLAKLATRADAVTAFRGSFGIRATEWNMYVAPLVTYPGNISAPPPAARAHLDRFTAQAFRMRGWAPWGRGVRRRHRLPHPRSAARTLCGHLDWGPAGFH